MSLDQLLLLPDRRIKILTELKNFMCVVIWIVVRVSYQPYSIAYFWGSFFFSWKEVSVSCLLPSLHDF